MLLYSVFELWVFPCIKRIFLYNLFLVSVTEILKYTVEPNFWYMLLGMWVISEYAQTSKYTIRQNALFQIVAFWVLTLKIETECSSERLCAPTGSYNVTTWKTDSDHPWKPQNLTWHFLICGILSGRSKIVWIKVLSLKFRCRYIAEHSTKVNLSLHNAL